MHSLLPFFGSTLFCLYQTVEGQTTNLAVPIVAPPSESWEGIDGIWSTFEIRVGTPPTTLRVLPATSWQEIWAIADGPNKCDTALGVSGNCSDARGGVWSNYSSSTWTSEGTYELQLDQNLGYGALSTEFGQYGLDTVGLGWNNATGTSLPKQVVAEISSNQFWFGILGIGFQPTNLTYENEIPSFSDSLYNSSLISSKSWSYTAGAHYRLKGVFGSLIFGGYDAKRFTPNAVTFNMAGDNERDIVLTIRSVTSTTAAGNTTLMSDAEFAFIDSSVSEFWLPVGACQAFEKAFGLQLDPTSGYYLLNASTHSALLQSNPTITFTLANEKTGGTTVDIVLPYAAFNLNISAPFLPNATSFYFPLRQGQNDTQYTLGRTFLQEAYVTTHYESRTFNVSQAAFPEDGGTQIVAIPPILSTSSNSSSTTNNNSNASEGSKLSSGAIAGIVVGAVAATSLLGLAIAFCLGLCCFSHRRRAKEPQEPVYEIDPGKRVEDPKRQSAYNAQASALTSEIPADTVRHEIGGMPVMHAQELEADVPMGMVPHVVDRRMNGMSNRTAGSSGAASTDISTESPRSANAHAVRYAGIIGSSDGPSSESGGNTSNEGSPEQHIVSPTSPLGRTEGFGNRSWGGSGNRMSKSRNVGGVTGSSGGGSGGNSHGDIPDITVSSPTDTWSPATPVQYRSQFQERWG